MNIKKWLGINNDGIGGTNLKLGELYAMQNFKITDGYKVQKRTGYTAQLAAALGHPIQGQWFGKIGDTETHLVACDGHIYKNVDGTLTDLGTLTDAKTDFFQFLDTPYLKQHKANVKQYLNHVGLGDIKIGQTFTTTKPCVFTSASFKISRYSAANTTTITAYLYTTSAGIPDTLVATAQNTVNGTSIGTGDTDYTTFNTVTFYFNSIPLSANTKYAVYIERSSGDTDDFYYVLASTNQYSGGSEIMYNGTNWGGTAYDLWFEFTFKAQHSVYILNGSEYYKYDGVTYSAVLGYVPIVLTSCLPGGSGTSYEPVNSLTGKKRQRFNGDGSATLFNILEDSVDSIDAVEVNGVDYASGYTLSLGNGKVDFSSPPGTGTDNVEIAWTKGTGSRTDIINKTNSLLYGGANDTRVFLYGDGNEVRYSDLAEGVQSAEYFPALNFITCGSRNTNVMNLSKQYDRMLINTETESLWSSYSYDATLGASFPTYPLNDSIGCTVKGCGQTFKNNPTVIFGNKIYQFLASNVRDERNAKCISDRVQPLLDAQGLSGSITFDNEADGEYWFCDGDDVYIYNYSLDVWYYFLLSDTVTSICKTSSGICLGTSTGQLMTMDTALTDNGTTINASLETGWIDFNVPERKKFIGFIWIQLEPTGDDTADVYYGTNKAGVRHVKLINTADILNLTFEDVNYENESYTTDYDPIEIRMKANAKNFVYIKFYIKNETTNSLTLLGLTANPTVGGTAK